MTRVIDGDTFEIGPRTIRVLGIDSCEASTDAGDAATAQARALLLAGPITLTTEPGVGNDRFDRELRYVQLADGRDFGTVMVAASHTAVYEGENDASPDYVAQLRATDPNGRTCDEPEPVIVPPPAEDEESQDTADVPDVNAPNPDVPDGGGDGRVGRDGDGDGLCNESTVPVPC
ncbi:MAG: thermonuclease family protein [Pseudonocardia sp.]|nr:thermonuclease family protein [Pseudonocardia sp.]